MIKQQAYALALLSIVLLSSNATAIAYASQFAHPIVVLVFSSSIISIVTLRRTIRFIAANKALFRSKYFYAMVFLKLANDSTFFYILGSTGQIDATVIIYLYPVTNILVSWLILDARYTRLGVRSWVLVLSSFASIVLLSPWSIFSDLSLPIFITCVLSAFASAYLVFIQKISDDIYGADVGGADLIGLLYLINTLFFGAALLVNAASGLWDIDVSISNLAVLLPIALWIGLVANFGSEVLWIRAARLYEDISLKSLFFLSPVLGALYLSFFGFDTLDPLVIFALTGVIVSNFLIHQQRVDDLSFVIFIFSIITFTVLVVNSTLYFDGVLFRLPEGLFDIHVATVSIILGFLLFRAFEVYGQYTEALTDFVVALANAMAETKIRTPELEAAIDRLLEEPDLALWKQEDRDKHALFWQALRSGIGRMEYLRFYRIRFTGVSYIEVFFGFVVSFSVVGLIIATVVDSTRPNFTSVFLMAIFVFIPFFMVDLASGRVFRPYSGVIVRRAAWASLDPFQTGNEEMGTRFVYSQRLRISIMLVLAFVMTAASSLLIWNV